MKKKIPKCETRRVTIDALMIVYISIFIAGLILIFAIISIMVYAAFTS